MGKNQTLSVRQTALKLGHTQKYIRDLLYEGKLLGAKKAGRAWAIPSSAVEARLKTRRKAEPEQIP